MNVELFLSIFQLGLLGVKNSRMRLLSEALKNKEVPVKLGIFQPFIHRPVRLPLNMPVKELSLFTLSQLLTHNTPDLPEIVLIMNNLSTITAQNNYCYSKNVSLHTYLWPIYGIQLVISSAFHKDLLLPIQKATNRDLILKYSGHIPELSFRF